MIPRFLQAPLLALVIGGGVWLYVSYVQHQRDVAIEQRDNAREELAAFRRQVQFEGETAAKLAKVQEEADARRKKDADAENARLRARAAGLARSLRDARANSSYVPPAPAGATDPDRATFDRAELERALRRLDEGVSGLLEEGDQAVTDLDTAKRWVQGK